MAIDKFQQDLKLIEEAEARLQKETQQHLVRKGVVTENLSKCSAELAKAGHNVTNLAQAEELFGKLEPQLESLVSTLKTELGLNTQQ